METDSGTISLDNRDEATHIIKLEILLNWTIKALPQGTLHMDIGMALVTILGLIAIANGVYELFLYLTEKRSIHLPQPTCRNCLDFDVYLHVGTRSTPKDSL